MRLNIVVFERTIIVLAVLQIATLCSKIFGIFNLSWWVVLIPLFLMIIHTILILLQVLVVMAKLVNSKNLLNDLDKITEEDGL